MTASKPHLAASISAVLLPSLAASQALMRGSGSVSLSGTELAALLVSPAGLHTRREHTADEVLLLMNDAEAAAEGDE